MSVPASQLRNSAPERFDFLKGALPNRINPTDIDLSYEVNGHFLSFEGKHPGEVMSRGQERYFETLNEAPNHNVIVFEGHQPAHLERAKILEQGEWVDVDSDDLRSWAVDWYKWAIEQPRYSHS